MVDKALMQAMSKAVREGDLAAVKSLVSTDDSLLRAKIPFGTWLHVAASNGKVNLLEYFLEKGIDVNAGGSLSGGTALNDAAEEGRLDAVKFLVSRGAQLNFPLPEQNPLFAAIVKGDIETAKFLIQSGIDTKRVYRRASGKKSDAHSFAIERGQKAIAALLQHGDSPASSPKPAGAPHESIIQHMAQHFGPVEELGLQEILPVVGVRINVIHPKKKKDPLILFTTGMSDLAQTVPAGREAYQYTELMVRLPANWPLDKNLSKPEFYWPVKWLLDGLAVTKLPSTTISVTKPVAHAGGPKAINLGGGGAEPLPSHPPAQPSKCVRRCDAAVSQTNQPTGSRCEASHAASRRSPDAPSPTRRHAGASSAEVDQHSWRGEPRPTRLLRGNSFQPSVRNQTLCSVIHAKPSSGSHGADSSHKIEGAVNGTETELAAIHSAVARLTTASAQPGADQDNSVAARELARVAQVLDRVNVEGK
jgi:hypothetical protein